MRKLIAGSALFVLTMSWVGVNAHAGADEPRANGGVARSGLAPDGVRSEAPAGQQIERAPAQENAVDTRPSFAEFLDGVRQEARTRGIRDEIIDEALKDVEEPLPVVIERDRTQAETVLSLETYLAQHVTETVIRHGRQAYADHRDLLMQVSAKYGVAPGVIVAVWGVESNFGRFSGIRPTVAALATLAWDPRRSSMFRVELLDALEILNRGDIDLDHLRGSWAGAMGQVQFMPSSYLQFAEDFDGDGKRDIWSSTGDVFASIAKYLSAHGWENTRSWGREVKLSSQAERRIVQSVARRNGTCVATRNMTVALPAEQWTKLGVRPTKGPKLTKEAGDLALVSGDRRHFLVTGNYDALLAYNCAHSYAVSVGILGDQIASTGRIVAERAPRSKAKSRQTKRGKKK